MTILSRVRPFYWYIMVMLTTKILSQHYTMVNFYQWSLLLLNAFSDISNVGHHFTMLCVLPYGKAVRHLICFEFMFDSFLPFPVCLRYCPWLFLSPLSICDKYGVVSPFAVVNNVLSGKFSSFYRIFNLHISTDHT